MIESTDMFGGPSEREREAPRAGEGEAEGQGAMFGDALAPPPSPAIPPVAQPYRVLARKYRPQTFSELIGQQPMVQTLANAIRRDRLAHAFLMTGVRGVGKTSTARLIAKALNCVGPDGNGGPTIDPCGVCEACVAIAGGRHIDVIEMDAASHNGIDDVRAMTDAVRYAAVSARYKIYIIDEVHMMSKPAFNALLKTLEEPPAHVKFLFATTEVEKLPVTVLSRCQRFDLRRIPSPQLAAHFAEICDKEEVAADPEALAMIAAAAEGSVRDGLSILDQAIAHADLESEARVTAAQVRAMLGLADRSVQRDLLAALLSGDGRALLGLVAAQYALGVEPAGLLRGLMTLVHRVTVAQIGGGAAEDAASVEEREAIEGWARALPAGQLHRLWQLLLKGHDEARIAPDPLVAAQMALLRVMHAADLPDPGELARRLEQRFEQLAAAPPGALAAAPVQEPAPEWGALADRVEAAGQLRIAQIMRDWVRVVSLDQGALRYVLAPGYSGDPSAELRDALLKATGARWTIERAASGEAAPTLRERNDAARAEAEAALREEPLVAAALAAFPGAEFIKDAAADDRRARSNHE